MSDRRACFIPFRRHACALSLAFATVASAHAAPVQIQVWHALPDANKAEFEKLAKQFNKDQSEVAVTLRAFPNRSALEAEATAAVKAKNAPNLIELEDNHSPEVVAHDKAIMPLYQLLAKYPVKDQDWYLPSATSFVRDDKNRLLAFPYMAEIPVMFYNTDAYKKVGLNPNAPGATWADLQADLLKLRDGDFECPYTTSDQVSVHLENLAAVNNQPYTSNANGLGGGKAGASTLQFNSLFMRHIALMVSWKRSLLFTGHAQDNEADQRFAKGECTVLTSGSGAFGEFNKARKLSFGVAPLPYYAQVTPQAGRPFVSGSALWAMAGRPQAEDKATASFLAWLSSPVIATKWHQETGYLPLTDAAFRASDVSFYNKFPGAHAVISSMKAPPGPNGRGFRMNNYAQIRLVLDRELNGALEGNVPPMTALDNASSQAKAIAAKR